MISIKDVDYIAQLARIRIDEDKKALFVEQFNTILRYIEKLNEVNTSNVSPITGTKEETSVIRKDVVGNSLTREDLTKLTEYFNDDGFFEVPKVI